MTVMVYHRKGNNSIGKGITEEEAWVGNTGLRFKVQGARTKDDLTLCSWGVTFHAFHLNLAPSTP